MTGYLNYKYDLEDPELAASYDELSCWAARFGTLLLDNIPLGREMSILDLGCGTGFPLVEIAQACGQSCRVTGMDLWAAGIEKAHSKLRYHNIENAALVRADGARLPFGASQFDLIVSNLGINNFADGHTVMAECYRVAKAGGQIALTTNLNGHMREFYAAFRETLRALGKTQYLPQLDANETHRGSKETTCNLVESAGFKVMRVIEDSFQMRYADGSALLNHRLSKLGFLGGWRGVVTPPDEVKVFEAIEARLNIEAAKQGHLRMTVPILYLQAEKSVDTRIS